MATNRLNTLLQMDNGDTSIVSLPINKLDFLENSPFKIYDGEKKSNLIESIKDNGIIIPIIVTPIENSRGRYTILSGANRVDAAIKLNIEEVQAVIKTDLTEDEYNLIVVETNLFNRSIDDMLPSELAKSLFIRQRSMRQQGKRSDLDSGRVCQNIQEGEKTYSSVMYKRLNEEYKLSERNIRNYIRLTYLCDELLDHVDNGIISLTAGFDLSYLKKEEQDILVTLMKEHNYKISMNIAQKLKQLSGDTKDIIDIKAILEESLIKPEKASNVIKIQIKDVKDYIKKEDLPNAKSIVIEALKLYYEMNS